MIAIRINGQSLQVAAGTTVAAAVMTVQPGFRRSVTGEIRGPLCGMGICMECRVTLNGHLHLVGVHIDPTVADPADPTLLEDLVQAAWQDAHDQVAQLQAAADPLGGLGGGLGGGGLGGLLGGG